MKISVSRTLSTQHPDNVRPPFFSDNAILGAEDEIKEAFYAFSHLGSREQLWDFEGKEVSNTVVKKLLTSYEPFFTKNKLGKDVFITMRVPNPDVEKTEAKILLEALESIPRSYDTARIFYGENITPIFEVSVPMVKDHKVLVRIAEYYKKIVVGKKKISLFPHDISVGEWIGDFNPEEIRIIPLLEDKEGILKSAEIVSEYIKQEKVNDYLRVWLARSDPALNYGSLANVLLCKIALQRLHDLEKETAIEILPILGCGSTPFRGNFKPNNFSHMLESYPSVQTFTIQSAFKYDYPHNMVANTIEEMNNSSRKKPLIIEEEKCLQIIEKVSMAYQKQIPLLAPYINEFSKHVPKRRLRKLHIGLFGYSRATAGVKLPRAIEFCASLYSLGLPPELLGLHVLTEKEIDFIHTVYKGFDSDLSDAAQFYNEDNISFLPHEIQNDVKKVVSWINPETDSKHKKITSIILDDYKKKNFDILSENIVRAGWIRGFLG